MRRGRRRRGRRRRGVLARLARGAGRADAGAAVALTRAAVGAARERAAPRGDAEVEQPARTVGDCREHTAGGDAGGVVLVEAGTLARRVGPRRADEAVAARQHPPEDERLSNGDVLDADQLEAVGVEAQQHALGGGRVGEAAARVERERGDGAEAGVEIHREAHLHREARRGARRRPTLAVPPLLAECLARRARRVAARREVEPQQLGATAVGRAAVHRAGGDDGDAGAGVLGNGGDGGAAGERREVDLIDQPQRVEPHPGDLADGIERLALAHHLSAQRGPARAVE
eukprot:scaffold61250_cov65-Phaeocystis_antarctica.AAC.2